MTNRLIHNSIHMWGAAQAPGWLPFRRYPQVPQGVLPHRRRQPGAPASEHHQPAETGHWFGITGEPQRVPRHGVVGRRHRLAELGLEIFDEEKGPDTDVTIPPAEILEPVPTVKEVPTAVPAALAEPESAKEQLTRAFGDGVVSQKPLDEVVLDFLVDNARKRKRPPK